MPVKQIVILRKSRISSLSSFCVAGDDDDEKDDSVKEEVVRGDDMMEMAYPNYCEGRVQRVQRNFIYCKLRTGFFGQREDRKCSGYKGCALFCLRSVVG